MFKTTAFASVPPANPDDATKQALLAIVQVWLDRLQAMAVVTTFFMSIDSMVYSFANRPSDPNAWSATDLLINASLGGAIIFHVCASILAYMGSFVLIRYRLNDAEEKEQVMEHPPAASASSTMHKADSMLTQNPSLGSRPLPSPAEIVREISWDAYTDLRSLVSIHQYRPLDFLCRGSRKASKRAADPEAPVTVADAAVETLKSMETLLSRCHSLTAIMTQLGFVLALLGIVTYFWTGLPRALGIFASVVLGGCLAAGAAVIL